MRALTEVMVLKRKKEVGDNGGVIIVAYTGKKRISRVGWVE